METLVKELEQTRASLVELVQSVAVNQVDTVPFEGSWTAGQLLEHIDKAVSPPILHGNVQPSQRPADEKVPLIKKIFLDFDTKMKSPEFIEPTEASHNKDVLLDAISAKFGQLIHAAATLNLGEECVDFEVPGMGKFTRQEWISFYMIHTQRHLHQLRNIISALRAK